MPEELAIEQQEQPAITDDIVSTWFNRADQLGVFDSSVVIDGELGPDGQVAPSETMILRDTVVSDKRRGAQKPDDHQTGTYVVILEKQDGTELELTAKDFLRRSRFNPEPLQATLAAEEEQRRKDAAESLANMRLAAAAEAANRQKRNRLLFAPIEDQPEFVTDSSKALAATTLAGAMLADSSLKAIIDQHIEQSSREDTLAARVEELRSSAGLRLAVGSYFLDKINQLANSHQALLPDRIISNSEKGLRGDRAYPKIPYLRSREYASMLCLAKIDGSFNEEASTGDAVTYDARGKAVEGQHRATADIVLSQPSAII